MSLTSLWKKVTGGGQVKAYKLSPVPSKDKTSDRNPYDFQMSHKESASSRWWSPAWEQDFYRGEVKVFRINPSNGKMETVEYKHTAGFINCEQTAGYVPMSKLGDDKQVLHGWGTKCCSQNGGTGGQKIEGYWKDGVLEGHGTYWFPNGDRFAGIFRDGMPGSKGTYWYQNGDVYRGDCIVTPKRGAAGDPGAAGFSRQGNGNYWYKNGSRYEGEFKENARHGQGIMFYAHGEQAVSEGIYEGSWQNGQMHGRGIFHFPSGKVSFGEYLDGEPNGHSVRWSADRSKAWRFMDGKQVEEISLSDASARTENCGHTLHNGLPPLPKKDGLVSWASSKMGKQQRTLDYADGSQYIGYIRDGVPDDHSGTAQMLYASGNKYEGEFANGCQEGFGCLTHPDGSCYKGDFQAGLKEGYGTFWHVDGDTYVGKFRGGHREGLGTYFFPDGAVLVSLYRAGSPKGPGVWWSPDRTKAGRLMDGQLVQRQPLEAAAELAQHLGLQVGISGPRPLVQVQTILPADLGQTRLPDSQQSQLTLNPNEVSPTPPDHFETPFQSETPFETPFQTPFDTRTHTPIVGFDQEQGQLMLERTALTPQVPRRPLLEFPSPVLEARAPDILEIENSGPISPLSAMTSSTVHDWGSPPMAALKAESRRCQAMNDEAIWGMPAPMPLRADSRGVLRRTDSVELTDRQMENMRKLFDEIDGNMNGTIEAKEFRKGMAALGHHFTEVQAEDFFKTLDVNGDSKLQFSEYVNLIKEATREKVARHTLCDLELTDRQVSAIRKHFDRMDVDKDGTVDAKEFQVAMRSLNVSMSEGEAEAYFRSLDINGDSKLQFEEYVNLIKEATKVKQRTQDPPRPTTGDSAGSYHPFGIDS